uniref:Heat shock 70 kDa protein 12A-like n=1 Tax=Poecilia reticulata TaxID=8081 RepID=A0A3P9PY70_POERE
SRTDAKAELEDFYFDEGSASTMGDCCIIAIKIGPTHTEYVYNITSSEEEIDPCLRWWGKEVGLDSPTTPTCILFDEHEQFISFGYEAKQSHLSISGQEARNMFFFDCFKFLYRNNLIIKSVNGKEMKALKVFTEALRFLKDDVLKTINKNTEGMKFTASDFTWVLTVPDSCDPSAKPFMRKAATQAGIGTDGNEYNLVIAQESEAALAWCMKLPAEGFITETRISLHDLRSPEDQHIVIINVDFVLITFSVVTDENIDIAVYEVLKGKMLKELHRSSVNDLGEKSVDRKYKEFLREIFTEGVWDEYEMNYPSEVQKMMYEFSRSKEVDENIQFCCPFNLSSLACKHQDIENFFEGVEGASWDVGSIKISRNKLRSFFAQSLQGITHNVREIFNKGFNIGCILLVGEYAACQVLRRHITDEFIDYCKVLCPFRPRDSVLKGAVELGKHQTLLQFQKSAFTYGIGVSDRFDELKHIKERKFTNKDGEWCGGLFIKLIEVGEHVVLNKTMEFTFYPVEADQTMMNFYFYRTLKKIPKYVTEEGVEQIGCLCLNSPNTEYRRSREVKLMITFDCREMKIKAKDLTSESKSSTKFDFECK